MSYANKVDSLLKLFKELREIMLAERETNWIRGINLIIESLSSDNTENAFKYAKDTYRKMSSGNGSFSDFYVWRDDFEERKEANDELERIKNDIWLLIDD